MQQGAQQQAEGTQAGKTTEMSQTSGCHETIHSDKCLDYESAALAEAPQNVALPKAYVILVI